MRQSSPDQPRHEHCRSRPPLASIHPGDYIFEFFRNVSDARLDVPDVLVAFVNPSVRGLSDLLEPDYAF